ncbi:ABC transporter ATP-binding protein [Flexivirga sp. ID2601S]|uniref:ABC-type quaternary amine transporter n=1 Tax=Flexivirga aerilata TaxID=1656889 RepID=A0A849AP55_9MICO|nr:ABC transporter ATP-binding protein [Flexivirga aerilata]
MGLEARRLTKSYAGAPVLQDVDLDVAAGSVAAVVGPSGCGKTTLLRCIAGFETPEAGQVRIDGRDVAGSAWVPAHRRRVGYVAQDGALFPHLTVGQNVGFGLPRRERSAARIGELLEGVALDADMARRRPDQLSGGQQQRVSLARALALRPRVMLLDEPFSALDTGLRARTREIVGDVLRGAGITTVLVTHDQEEALSFADQVAVMARGGFRQVGSPTDVYLHPADLETARFTGETVELRATAADGRVETPFGAAAVDTDLTGPVRMVLRPEQVEVRAADDAPDNADAAVVEQVDFRGDHVRVRVGLPGETEPLVLRAATVAGLRVGDRVRLRISGEANVFPDRD